jgi:hypothetical protein
MLKQKKLDLIPALCKGEQCQKAGLELSKEAVVSTWGQVYASPGSSIQALPNLDNMFVGVVKSSSGGYDKEFRKIVRQYDLNCQIVEFKSLQEMFEAIQSDWVGAGVGDRLRSLSLEREFPVEKTPVLFSPLRWRFAALRNGKGHNMLRAIDYNLALMKKNPKSVYFALLDNFWSIKKKAGY